MNKEYRNTKYMVSNEGTIISPFSKKQLKGWISPNGYRYVYIKKETYLVHRIVAELFLKPPKDVYDVVVNHKDGNKLNNAIDNLEYISRAKNTKHAFETGLIKNSKKIYCVELNKHFNSITEASEFVNISRTAISACLNGKQKTAGYSREINKRLTWEFIR